MIVLSVVAGLSIGYVLYVLLDLACQADTTHKPEAHPMPLKKKRKIILTIVLAIIIAISSVCWIQQADTVLYGNRTEYIKMIYNKESMYIFQDADANYYYVQFNYFNPIYPTYRIYLQDSQVESLKNTYTEMENAKKIFNQTYQIIINTP